MNCDTITMPANEAAAKLEEYESAMSRNPKQVTEQDRQILRALKIAVKGGRLINVNDALAAGGLNRANLPRLALARAHVRSVFFGTGYHPGLRESQLRFIWMEHTRHRRVFDDRVQWWLTPNTFPGLTVKHRYEAMTPLIPLPLRPKADLKNYFLMWEANWHPSPPVDPYLLRPLTGSLMEIVAEWDVSPLELAAVRSAMIR